MPVSWVLTVIYCVVILTPPGQYILIVAAMLLPMAFGSVVQLAQLLWPGDESPKWLFVLSIFIVPSLFGFALSIAGVSLASPPNRQMSHCIQVAIMWTLGLTLTVVASTRMVSMGALA